MKKWNILNDVQDVKALSTQEIIAALLENRGLKTQTEIKSFIYPQIEDVTIKSVGIDKKQLSLAIKRLKKAIAEKEFIIVYTDYDVDGICGGAIIWETLHHLGARTLPYVPHRVEEGYGLSHKGIDILKKDHKDLSLIVTVDHGISAFEKVEYAKTLGIETIIIDHHEPPENPPNAHAVVHTTSLSGSGVAWMLAQELSPQADQFLDLVALATVADLVPLTGANRILASKGLEVLNKTKRVGLRTLIEESGLSLGMLDTYDVGHILAPRINAMGRLTHGLDALRLLCTRNIEKALNLARKLNVTNKERQSLTQETILYARSLFTKTYSSDLAGTKLLFLDHESFNQGIIGLVAGKLAEEYYRPTVIISRGLFYSKASARSIAGFNIIEAIRSLGDLLVDCGGHPMAAGFTVETAKLSLIKDRLVDMASKELDEEKLTRSIKIDCMLELHHISEKLFEEIKRFKPFGIGNPEPVFAADDVIVREARIVGKERKHLKLKIQNTRRGVVFDAIGFNLGELYADLQNVRVSIAFTIDKNTWNGITALQLKIKDIKLANKGKT